VPQGAEEADGIDDLIKKTRNQIGRGADLIKIYADYRWGLRGEASSTFSLDEIKLIVATAQSAGRPTVAHASTVEGMCRAISEVWKQSNMEIMAHLKYGNGWPKRMCIYVRHWLQVMLLVNIEVGKKDWKKNLKELIKSVYHLNKQ
jgi:hypothetical protein